MNRHALTRLHQMLQNFLSVPDHFGTSCIKELTSCQAASLTEVFMAERNNILDVNVCLKVKSKRKLQL